MSETVRAMDFEEQFVGHLSDTEALVHFKQEGVTGELLLGNLPRVIWAFAVDYYDKSRVAPQREVLVEQFPAYEFIEPRAAPHWLVEKLRERFRQGEVQEIVRQVAVKSAEPDEALSYLRERVFEVERVSGSAKHVYTADDFDAFLDEYQQGIIDGFHRGFTYGFEEVNESTGGQRPGQLGFLCARPKRFKTFLLLKMFLEQQREGRRPMFVSLELNPQEVWQRLICLASGFPFDKMDKRGVMEADYEEWRFTHRQLQKAGNTLIIRPPVGERDVSRIFMEADKLDADSIIIDQLSFMEGTQRRYDQEHMRYREIVYDLKNCASRSGSERPVMVAAQFNREAANLDEMADAAKAGLTRAIEEACDILFGVHRTKDMAAQGLIQLGVIEARHTEIDDWLINIELKKKTEFQVVPG